jgi:hypothetical protein
MDSQANWIARFERTFTGPASAAAARIWQVWASSTAARQRARITEMVTNLATMTRRVLVTAQRHRRGADANG